MAWIHRQISEIVVDYLDVLDLLDKLEKSKVL